MSRNQAIGEINEEIYEKQPHSREVPLQRAAQTLFIVPVLRDLGPAAKGRPYGKAKAKERLPVVDAPSATDHHDDRDRIEPMSDPYRQGVQHNRAYALPWRHGYHFRASRQRGRLTPG